LSFPKIILVLTVTLFSIIGVLSLMKKEEGKPLVAKVEEIEIEKEETVAKEAPIKQNVVQEAALPKVDLIDRMFTLGSKKLPIVDTITYTSRVPWLSGREAWVADYAAYYSTTRHFIARSLNHGPDYFTQKVSLGDRFNVLRKDIELEFYLVVDLSRSTLLFFSLDKTHNERILLKTYPVGLGRKDENKESGLLTPLGKYQLGEKVAIYKEGTKGYFQEEKIEMLQVFGTRWIPFGSEVSDCTEPAKGYGIHGAPWKLNSHTGKLEEDTSVIGAYDSDGCIRLASKDIEEIFAIIISKPTTIHIVQDFFTADLPGEERGDL
jgi:hypothetical protein